MITSPTGVTATDGPDTFRINTWTKSTGDVLYDSTTATKPTGFITVAGTRSRRLPLGGRPSRLVGTGATLSQPSPCSPCSHG